VELPLQHAEKFIKFGI